MIGSSASWESIDWFAAKASCSAFSCSCIDANASSVIFIGQIHCCIASIPPVAWESTADAWFVPLSCATSESVTGIPSSVLPWSIDG